MKKIKIHFPNWKDLSFQTANFYFSETEKKLNETVSTFMNNKDRAFGILKILLPILTVSVGFILSKENDWDKLIPAIYFFAFQSLGIACLVFVILPREIHTSGSIPSLLIHPQSISEDEKEQFIGIILNQCENLEPRILFNIKQNVFCSRLITLSIVLSGVFAPLSFIICLFS